MKLQNVPLHQRPREKLVTKGVENLKDKELLALLFRTGNRKKNVIELSELVLKKYPLNQLLQLQYKDLIEISGIDIGKATSLLAAFELTKRALAIQDNHLPEVHSPKDVLNQVQDIRNLKKEYFVALFLNARNQLLHKETVSIGTLTSSLVHPREVFEPALRYSAAGILVVHNHPSGDISPSDKDIDITHRLIEVGTLIGIDIIDHIIVTSTNYLSMKELDIIK